MKYNLMSRDNLIVPNMEDGSIEVATGGEAPVVGSSSPNSSVLPANNTSESEA